MWKVTFEMHLQCMYEKYRTDLKSEENKRAHGPEVSRYADAL
jgi:hypothetical protein